MCQEWENLQNSVNQCFPNDQWGMLQYHKWVKDSFIQSIQKTSGWIDHVTVANDHLAILHWSRGWSCTDAVTEHGFPKKSITRHTWLQWDVGSEAFYSGDCGLRIEFPSTRQMDSQGLCSSTIQVTIWGLFKAQGQWATLWMGDREGEMRGHVFNTVLQLVDPTWDPWAILTSSDWFSSLGSLSTTE